MVYKYYGTDIEVGDIPEYHIQLLLKYEKIYDDKQGDEKLKNSTRFGISPLEQDFIIREITPLAKLYRKKPIAIRAFQMDKPFKVATIEGVMSGKAGDWLIKGIKGELYPCDKAIFEATYEKVLTEEEQGLDK